MALQVWLPLNGNLNNQGLTNVTVTNSGATIDNNGKIGKCYAFNGKYISFNRPLPDPCSAFTVCGWVKLSTGYATNNGLHLISFETSYGRICISKDGLAVRVLLNYGGASSATGSNATDSSISANVWNHYAVTFDSGKINIYINGQLDNSYTIGISQVSITSSILKVGTYSSEASKGCVNDFRLYDHALSPKEIEILSRGLVCHYPLSGGGRGGDNLLKNTGDLTLWAKEAGITTTWDSEKNMYKIEDSTHTNSRWGIYQDINVEANTSYTITVTLDGTACGAGFAVYDGSTSFPPAVISTTGRQSYTLTSGANSTKARVYLYTNCGVGKVAWFSLPKVEKSDHTTPWMPNPADTAYAKMGYNSTTEYDVSGYGYNGVKNNITYNSNTARYSVCSKFSSSSTRIAFSDIYVGNEWSYGLWVKAPQSTTRTWETVVMLNETGSDSDTQLSFWLNLKANSCQSSANKQYNASIAYPNDGNWHHFFATFDGSNLKTYIDGELVNTKAITNAWFQRTHLTIGAYRTGDNTYTSYSLCDLSDFRLYATALSAAQVAELYNTAASVANNGTLMGYELVEV